MARTGARWLNVPYRGTGPASRALLAGEVQLMFVPAGSVQALLATGRVHAVAVANFTRLESLPATPTFAEAGVQGAEFAQWYGLFAPAGTPAAVTSVLQNATLNFLADGDVRRQLKSLDLEPAPMGGAEFAEFLAGQARRLATFVKQVHVEGSIK
jgi:tripartite-type tricarboxylate transporter receptor subunit TctC